jgi:NitT/TauT family transport system substrate-binding protein
MTRIARLAVAAVAASLAVGVSACGTDSGSPASPEGPTTVRIGLPPFVDSAPIYVGIERGFFAAEGLALEPVVQQSGAALLPSVVKGDLELGIGNPVSVMLAQANGLDLRALGINAVSSDRLEDSWTPVMVPQGSDVAEPGDLAGRTIGINGIRSLAEIVVRASLEKHGVDPASVRFLEVPLPDMVAAMESGRIDAAALGEPFSTLAAQAGHQPLLDPFTEVSPRMPISLLFSATRFAESDQDVVARFVRAYDTALGYCAEHPDAVRAAIPTFTQIPEPVAAAMKLPAFTPGLDTARLDVIADLMVQYGLVDERPDVSELAGT